MSCLFPPVPPQLPETQSKGGGSRPAPQEELKRTKRERRRRRLSGDRVKSAVKSLLPFKEGHSRKAQVHKKSVLLTRNENSLARKVRAESPTECTGEDEGLGTELLDPIMLTPIGPADITFVYIRPNGREVVYRVSSLVDYMLFSGKFQEPETGLVFSDEQLSQLDALVKKMDESKASVLEAKQNPAAFVQKQNDSNGLIGLERCCGEFVGSIPSIIEKCEDSSEGQIRLLTDVFPEILYYFEQIVALDKEFAKQSLKQYISFVHGPPNRPIDDSYGLLALCNKQFEELGHLCSQESVSCF